MSHQEPNQNATQVNSAHERKLSGCTILVIGGTGLSGTCTVQRLLSLAEEDTIVRVMSRSANPQAIKKTLGSRVEVVQGNVADPTALQSAMEGVTHVLYLVGPKPSLSYFFNGKTMEQAYVTGLRNVLEQGRKQPQPLRQVLLLSAENCDKPWHPMTMLANNIAGYTQLMHFRQERLLREEAKQNPNFSYVCIRPPILGPADVRPEPVMLQSIDSSEASSHPPTRTVSRAAIAELMVHALDSSSSMSQRCITFTLTRTSEEPALDDFDWRGTIDVLPQDSVALAGPERDASHYWGRRTFLFGFCTIVITVMGALSTVAYKLLSS